MISDLNGGFEIRRFLMFGSGDKPKTQILHSYNKVWKQLTDILM